MGTVRGGGGDCEGGEVGTVREGGGDCEGGREERWGL